MIYDLTHPLEASMPVYPGKNQPVIFPAAQIEIDGYREIHLQIDGHTGTHIDSPAHMLEQGKKLDQYPPEKFTGKAIVIPAENIPVIEISDLKLYEDEIKNADFVLFRTGWCRYWGTPQYLGPFPVLSKTAAGWLTTFRLKGIGVDAISVDPLDSADWPVHHILFNNDMTIIENLRFPEGLPNTGIFHCFPLPVKDADGTPVRAVLSGQS
jgi:arylformamidase